MLNTNKLTHQRHYLPTKSPVNFPIREDEPTSVYAFALSNEKSLTPCELEVKNYIFNSFLKIKINFLHVFDLESQRDPEARVLSLDHLVTCKIYHFNAFKKLRDFVGETDFVQSIMRCSKWEAKGGKSGASFFKSHDKRFVIKHIGVKGKDFKNFKISFSAIF